MAPRVTFGDDSDEARGRPRNARMGGPPSWPPPPPTVARAAAPSAPPAAPRGHCPRCLLRQGLDGSSLSLWHAGELGATADFSGSRVLETLAATVGPVPRVLLRDADTWAEPPVVRPPDRTAAGLSIRYRIDGEIARGGMGEVLKGRDPDLGRDVAIKVLRDDLSGRPEMVRRFVEEAQIGGQLQHPGIVPVYELGTFADRRPFFSMKLVKGQTLAQLLAARPSPADGLPRSLGIFEQVAQTVAYAHARGVIHRDLKPSNVMVGSFGEVQVMDWGLAKVLPRGGVADDAAAGREPDRETVIATARQQFRPGRGAVAGRLGAGHARPTWRRSRPGARSTAVDERADVFALGSILCEVLTGSPAFTGRTSAETQRKAARGDTAEALARLDACGADAELVVLARDCLAAEPPDRPRDAGAVRERITAYLAGVQERLRAAEIERARAEARAAEERRRRRLQLGLAASLLALTTLGGLAFTYELQRRQARRRAGRPAADRGGVVAQPGPRRARGRRPLGAPPGGPGPDRRGARPVGFGPAGGDAPGSRGRAGGRQGRPRAPGSAGGHPLGAGRRPGRLGHRRRIRRRLRRRRDRPRRRRPGRGRRRVAGRPKPVAAALVAALDHWSAVRRARHPKGPGWARRLAAARAADPDPDRDALRGPARGGQGGAAGSVAAAGRAGRRGVVGAGQPGPAGRGPGRRGRRGRGDRGTAAGFVVPPAGRPGPLRAWASCWSGCGRRSRRRRSGLTRSPGAGSRNWPGTSWPTRWSGAAAERRPRRSGATWSAAGPTTAATWAAMAAT